MTPWERERAIAAGDRKKKLVMGAVCGPISTALFVLIFYTCVKLKIPADGPHQNPYGMYLKISGGLTFFLMLPVAELLGRYLKITAERYAGAVAMGCTICLAVVIAILIR